MEEEMKKIIKELIDRIEKNEEQIEKIIRVIEETNENSWIKLI